MNEITLFLIYLNIIDMFTHIYHYSSRLIGSYLIDIVFLVSMYFK